MRSAHWYTSSLSYDSVIELSRTLGISEVTAEILARRGYTEPSEAEDFLAATGELHDPYLLDGMKAACERIEQAIRSGEKICVHGDYDVDGITATALLVNILKELGADVISHLPNRFHEGYGINSGTLSRLAGDGVSLMVTVDCGISAAGELELAAGLGLETIVTDHHQPVDGELPRGIVVSPLLSDYPFQDLSGAGIAFKLAQGLLDRVNMRGDGKELHPLLKQQLPLVALGTIADVVPLLGENRSLVKMGLVQLARSRNPGLRALMREGQIESSRLNAGLVAFRMAPRINAAGRLDDPAPALELLLTDNEMEAQKLAEQLGALNRERQKIENRILAEAQEIINRWPDERKSQRAYVLSSPGWHEGVIGIVASRLVDLYYRPVLMISEGDGQGKGSGRSIPPFDLHRSLVDHSDYLIAFGGHRAACGLTINVDDIESFRASFADYADDVLSEEDLQRSRYVDALISGRDLTLKLAEELSQLEPFGLGNPSVDLVATGARVSGGRATRDGQHLQCRVETGGVSSSAIGFGQAYLLDKLKNSDKWDVIFSLERNEFNGSVSPQLNLRELIPRPDSSSIGELPCKIRCGIECANRISGDELWSLLSSDVSLPQGWQGGEEAATMAAAGDLRQSGRLVDRRNHGAIPQQIAKLISGGENVLLLVADVPRRRRLFAGDLPAGRLIVERLAVSGGRCSQSFRDRQLQGLSSEQTTLALADFTTAAEYPQILEHFKHLVFVDPPYCQSVLTSMAAAAPEAYIHLIYCGDEVQFTEKVLRHEYDLRESLTNTYRHLGTGNNYPLDEATERLLLAGGKYLRQPLMVARCLRILTELELVSIEESREGPILKVPKADRTDLQKSPTFAETQVFFKTCQKYLNRLKSTKTI